MLRKSTLTIILLTFCISATFAQAEIFGISLSDTLQYKKEWPKASTIDGYIENVSMEYIETAVMQKHEGKLKIYLLADVNSTLRFIRIKQQIEINCEETYDNDYIPDSAKGDNEYIETLISLGKAEIYREYKCGNNDKILLNWSSSGITISMSSN